MMEKTPDLYLSERKLGVVKKLARHEKYRDSKQAKS
jgi:hypothetical protein